jgi:hypothetical protein
MIGEMGYRKSRGQKRGGDRKTAHAQLDTRQREARSSTCDCCEPVATVDELDTTFTDAATFCRQYQVAPEDPCVIEDRREVPCPGARGMKAPGAPATVRTSGREIAAAIVLA